MIKFSMYSDRNYISSRQQRLWSDRVNMQADLSLHWVHVILLGFFCVLSHFWLVVLLLSDVNKITENCQKEECPWKVQHSSSFFSIGLPSQCVIKLSGKIKKKFTPLWFHPFRWKHCNVNTGIFQWSFEWDCRGVIRILIFYLVWPEWKGLQFYSPLLFHPFGWKHRGIAEWSQGEYHKITGNVWVEPWVWLQGANAPRGWVGNWKTPWAVL